MLLVIWVSRKREKKIPKLHGCWTPCVKGPLIGRMWEDNSTQVFKCMNCQIFSSVETSHKSIPDFSLSLWMCTTHQTESSRARHMRCGESRCCVQIYFLLHASMIFPLLLVRKRGEIFPLQFTEEVKENLFHFNHKHSVLTFHMCVCVWRFCMGLLIQLCAILCM